MRRGGVRACNLLLIDAIFSYCPTCLKWGVKPMLTIPRFRKHLFLQFLPKPMTCRPKWILKLDHHVHEVDHLDQRSMDRSFQSVKLVFKLRGNNKLAHLSLYIKVSCQKFLSQKVVIKLTKSIRHRF